MTDIQGALHYRVSRRGQVSLPAEARRRWGITDGGDIEVFDLGDALILLPGGDRSARRSLARALTAERYDAVIAGIEDAELRDQ